MQCEPFFLRRHLFSNSITGKRASANIYTGSWVHKTMNTERRGLSSIESIVLECYHYRGHWSSSYNANLFEPLIENLILRNTSSKSTIQMNSVSGLTVVLINVLVLENTFIEIISSGSRARTHKLKQINLIQF